VQFRRLALVWGVTPVLIAPSASTEELIEQVEQVLVQRNLARAGDHVVITMGVPVGAGLSTNLLKIHQVV
jgi:pyruvate kinase